MEGWLPHAGWYRTCDRTLAYIENAMMLVAALFLFLIMMIVATDVVMRYFFNAPLAWSYELISLYLMSGLFFLAVAHTLRANGHVAVDILHLRMSPAVRHACLALTYSLAAALFALMLITSSNRAWTSLREMEVTSGVIAWPVWIGEAFVPIGAATLLLRLVLQTIGHVMSLFVGRDVVELPPIAGHEAD